MITSNFHTHTSFCDGKDTPEEIVIEAIKKGFTKLGFSGHSYTEPDKSFAMDDKKAYEYRLEVNALKEKYRDDIEIYCGIEQDIFSSQSTKDYDYVIGSVHHILKDGKYLTVDESASTTAKWVNDFYDGDFDSYAEDYFRNVSKVIEITNADIIGHIDLVSKFSEKNGYRQSERFLSAAEKAIKNLVKYNKPFEINTGAIARRARTIPYPTPEILKLIKNNGGKIVFSSDCHDKKYLDCAFDYAVKLAVDCGFTQHGVLTKNGMKFIKI